MAEPKRLSEILPQAIQSLFSAVSGPSFIDDPVAWLNRIRTAVCDREVDAVVVLNGLADDMSEQKHLDAVSAFVNEHKKTDNLQVKKMVGILRAELRAAKRRLGK